MLDRPSQLPSSALPIEHKASYERLLAVKDGPAPSSAGLQALVFAMELDIVLVASDSDVPLVPPAPGAPTGAANTPQMPPPSPEPPDGSLRSVAFLSSQGLKLASLRVSSPRKPQPLPAWLSGARSFGNDLVSELARGGRLQGVMVGEPERGVLNDDLLFERLLKDRPKQSMIDRALELAQRAPRPLGFNVDDMYLLCRDAQGQLWGFELHVERESERYVLDAAPLVSVRKFVPERDS